MAHAAAGETAAALQAVDRALATGPHQLAHRSCKTSLLDMTGQQAAAIAGQNALLETFPDFSEGWLNLSIMHIHAGDLVSARQSLAKADRGSLTNEAPTKLQDLYDRLAATLAAPLH
jgi:predicted Zn-dependent protease